jgi:hypothetical protein
MGMAYDPTCCSGSELDGEGSCLSASPPHFSCCARVAPRPIFTTLDHWYDSSGDLDEFVRFLSSIIRAITRGFARNWQVSTTNYSVVITMM